MIRRLAGALALVAVLAASVASHHHAVFSGESGARSEEVVTTHNPHSTASHWHAILKILPVDPCWACQWSRVVGLRSTSANSQALIGSRELNAFPPRAAISIARFTRRSRGPPALL